MKALFNHQNFPRQFVYLADMLARDTHNVLEGLSIYKRPVPHSVASLTDTNLRSSEREKHPVLHDQKTKTLRAEACAAAEQLTHECFIPDMIVAHPGREESLLIKEIFPQARLITYYKYCHALKGQHIGVAQKIPAKTFQRRCKLHLCHATNLRYLEMSDAAISSRYWQKGTPPKTWHDKAHVIHDGVAVDHIKPNPEASLRWAANVCHLELVLKPSVEGISTVALILKDVRAFPHALHLLPKVLEQHLTVHAEIAGDNALSYGGLPSKDKGSKECLMDDVSAQHDMRRRHFVGKVPCAVYLNLLNVSKVHACWSAPFVLLRSLLKAALHGMPVVASDTQPTAEFAQPPEIQSINFFDQSSFLGAMLNKLAQVVRPRKNRQVIATADSATFLKQQIASLHAV